MSTTTRGLSDITDSIKHRDNISKQKIIRQGKKNVNRIDDIDQLKKNMIKKTSQAIIRSVGYNLEKDPWEGQMEWVQKPRAVRRPFIKFTRPVEQATKTSWRARRKTFRQEMARWKKNASIFKFQATFKYLLVNMAPKIERRRPIETQKPFQQVPRTQWRTKSRTFRTFAKKWKMFHKQEGFKATWMTFDNFFFPKIERREFIDTQKTFQPKAPTTWRAQSKAFRETVQQNKKGIYAPIPLNDNWREKSKTLRYEIRKIRVLKKAAKPDFRKKSAGFREFVQRQKNYFTNKGQATKNWRKRSMTVRQSIKADREKFTQSKGTQKVQGTEIGNINQELFRKNWMMMFATLAVFFVIMGVFSTFMPKSFIGGIAGGIFMGMGALAVGFNTRLLTPIMPRK